MVVVLTVFVVWGCCVRECWWVMDVVLDVVGVMCGCGGLSMLECGMRRGSCVICVDEGCGACGA